MWWMPSASNRASRFLPVYALALLVCAFLISVSAKARADSHSIAILAIASDDDDAAASALTSALRAEAAADETLRLSNSHASLSQMTISQDCEITDPSCRTRVAEALSVQLVVYGEVRRLHGDYEADLHLFGDDGSQVAAKRVLPSRDVGHKNLASHARELLRELRAKPEPIAESVPAPSKPVVAPDVAPLREHEPEEPPPARTHASNDWVGYTLLGVAAVSVGLTVLSWTEIGSANDDASLNEYRKAVGSSNQHVGDSCDEADSGRLHGVSAKVLGEARDACRKGRTFQTLQYVFLGTALVAAGVGTYFLLDGDGGRDSSSARLRLDPEIGRSSAMLRVRLEL